MSTYSLAIDAGGSKTLGMLGKTNSDESWSASAAGASLSNDIDNSCKIINQVINQLLTDSGIDANQINAVCGAAGAGNEASRLTLLNSIQANFNNLLITTDARTSLYGAGLGGAIVVVAIGTGTVAMRLDASGYEKQFGGWGFIVGDQGGGAAIGRELISKVVFQFDDDEATETQLYFEVLKQIGTTKQQILSWLKNASPSQFAAFSPLLFSYYETDPTAKKIISKAVSEIEKLIQQAVGKTSLKVVLMGGLASLIEPLLSEHIKQLITTAKGDALSGAFYLADKL